MSKLRIVPSQKLNRDVKLAIKRGYNIQLLDAVVEMIAKQQLLPPKYKDHKLIGNYSGCRECYITPDRLLIYEISNEELILYLTRTGTHSDLFQALKARQKIALSILLSNNIEIVYVVKVNIC